MLHSHQFSSSLANWMHTPNHTIATVVAPGCARMDNLEEPVLYARRGPPEMRRADAVRTRRPRSDVLTGIIETAFSNGVKLLIEHVFPHVCVFFGPVNIFLKTSFDVG